MKTQLLCLPLAVLLGATACDSGSAPTVTPEPLDELVLYDSYGELLVAVLFGLRDGDLSMVKGSIASDGQLETMCHDYRAPTGGPYEPPSIVAASSHCKEVFAPIPEAALDKALDQHPYGRNAELPIDTAFATHWRDRCPAEFNVYELTGIFEIHDMGEQELPQAGLEVDGVFSYNGRWGLMSIPRCRGEGE